MNEVWRLSSNELIKEEEPACQANMSPFVMFCVDFRKRYQVTCRVAFLGPVCVLNFSDPFRLSVCWSSYDQLWLV